MMKRIGPWTVVIAALWSASLPLDAATLIWDGEASDGNFANAVNWNGNTTVPSSGDTLQVGANLGSSAVLAFNSPAGLFNAPSFTFLPAAATSFTVTAASFSDSLNLTGTGVTLQNASSVRQSFSVITVSTATSQTWDGGSKGIQFAQVDLGNNNTLTISGTGTTAATRNEALGGFTGTGISCIIKAGLGTLLFNTSATNDYTGPTRISDGRLQLGANNQIPNGSKLVLDGGIFGSAGFDDTLGAISMTKNSTIDFGLGADLVFAASAAEDWSVFTLNILNFTTGQNTWRIGTTSSGLTGSQLSHIVFNGTTPAVISADGFLTPFPEPSTFVLLAGGLLTLATRRQRRPAERLGSGLC